MSNFLLFADLSPTENVLNIVSIIAIALLAVVGTIICVTNRKNNAFNTKSIVYGGICVAGSFVLSFIKLEMGYGGSVTLASMLPLFIYCYVFGVGRGLIVGIVYGLLQFIQNPYFLNVPQFLLDYILPFGFIALSGVFKKIIPAKGAIFAGAGLFSFLRLASHVGSGIIFFNMGWTVDTFPLFGSSAGMGSFVYSLVYNALYMVPETLILMGVLWYLVASKQFFTLENMMIKAKTEETKQA